MPFKTIFTSISFFLLPEKWYQYLVAAKIEQIARHCPQPILLSGRLRGCRCRFQFLTHVNCKSTLAIYFFSNIRSTTSMLLSPLQTEFPIFLFRHRPQEKKRLGDHWCLGLVREEEGASGGTKRTRGWCLSRVDAQPLRRAPRKPCAGRDRDLKPPRHHRRSQ